MVKLAFLRRFKPIIPLPAISPWQTKKIVFPTKKWMLSNNVLDVLSQRHNPDYLKLVERVNNAALKLQVAAQDYQMLYNRRDDKLFSSASPDFHRGGPILQLCTHGWNEYMRSYVIRRRELLKTASTYERLVGSEELEQLIEMKGALDDEEDRDCIDNWIENAEDLRGKIGAWVGRVGNWEDVLVETGSKYPYAQIVGNGLKAVSDNADGHWTCKIEAIKIANRCPGPPGLTTDAGAIFAPRTLCGKLCPTENGSMED